MPRFKWKAIPALFVCLTILCLVHGSNACSEPDSSATAQSAVQPFCRAVDFQEMQVYTSPHKPGYVSWVSFFPGWNGEWYLTCEEVIRPDKPMPRTSMEDWFAMDLPHGYDKSQYLMECVILESKDDMKTWNVISRQPVRYQHSAGSFGQAKTKSGNFLRFMWECYSLDPNTKPNECFYKSSDNGKTWRKMPAFLDPRFAYYPHRLRTLKDGTLVLAVPQNPKWKPGTDRPVRETLNLNALSECQMTLYFSFNGGRVWKGPVEIFPGMMVSETDFVELPDGNLLFISNSIFENPGRQIVYRNGRRFTPGFYQKAVGGGGVIGSAVSAAYSFVVPETVCLTDTGVLVGCMRNGGYSWSDDYGLTWWPLEGARKALYQPWIQYLGDGRIACAGHFGSDDPIALLNKPGDYKYTQYIGLQTFKIITGPKKEQPKLTVERGVDYKKQAATNTFIVKLSVGDKPLPGKKVEFWYVERDKPGYDFNGVVPLEERMKIGGTLLTPTTDANGEAKVNLSKFDNITYIHHKIQIVAMFNMDRSDPAYIPVQSPQMDYYTVMKMSPPLETRDP